MVRGFVGLGALALIAVASTGCTTSHHAVAPVPTSTSSATAPAPINTSARGSIYTTVPATTVSTQAPVPLTAPATVADTKVTAAIVKTAKVTAVGQGPGEFSGPAYAITVQISNGTGKAVDLSQVVVNMTDKNGAPFTTISGKPAAPLPASLASDAKATGVYVFALNVSHPNPAEISVSYSATAPLLVFRGNV